MSHFDAVPLVASPDKEHEPARLQPDGRKRFAAFLVLAQFALMFSILTPVVVALSIKLATIAPSDAVGLQGLTLGVGSLMGLIAGPLFGNLSDRTRSRFGRRRPWLLGGALVGAAALITIGVTDSVPVVIVAFTLMMLTMNAAVASISGLYADRIPDKWQGRVGALLGVATNFGAIAGAAVATIFSSNIVLVFAIPGLLAVVTVIAVCLVAKDSKDDVRIQTPFSVMEIIRSFGWPVRANRDFSINFASRFLIWLGYGALMSYQALLFIIHFGIPPQEVAMYMFASTGIAGITTLVGSFGVGWISDNTDRRRGFVLFAGILIGVALILMGLAPTVELVIAAGALCGFGLGIYLAVDLSLAVRLIPDRNSAGRYMGIVNLANTLPGMITPFAAPAILAIAATPAAPNFMLLFVVAGITSIIGALLMAVIRSVR